jgi:uncharacterized protein YyaL (SSP411 family)
MVHPTAGPLREMYAESMRAAGPSGALDDDMLVRAVRSVAARYDREHGGTRGAPKFPPAMSFDFLLRRWARTGDESLLDMAAHTFRAMARGGIYDQVGGGFHRYAVDAIWLVPHFEKMLYDNALLARLGVHLWQATQDAEARRVTEETLRWVAREMTAPNGGFYATLDADSEGHEGKFYVWDHQALRDALDAGGFSPSEIEAVVHYWGVTPAGNFEGHNIPFVSRPSTAQELEPAAEEGSDASLADAVRRAKAALLHVRERRVRPARDEKMLAMWNGLMLRAVAEAARAFGDPALRELALRNGEFLASTLVTPETGRVMRAHTAGVTRIPGFLEDHAAVALGFLALWGLTFEERWLDLARRIGEATVAWFWDEAVGAFFDTASDAERLVTRPRDPTDNATPSGTSLAVELLLVLADLTGEADYRRRADRVLASLAEPMARHAPAFGHLLGAADLAVDGAVELVLVGDPGAADFRALAEAAGERYVPSLVIDAVAPRSARGGPLRDGRTTIAGKATAYVCRHGTCDLPTTDRDTLAGQLASAARSLPGRG